MRKGSNQVSAITSRIERGPGYKQDVHLGTSIILRKNLSPEPQKRPPDFVMPTGGERTTERPLGTDLVHVTVRAAADPLNQFVFFLRVPRADVRAHGSRRPTSWAWWRRGRLASAKRPRSRQMTIRRRRRSVRDVSSTAGNPEKPIDTRVFRRQRQRDRFLANITTSAKRVRRVWRTERVAAD